MQDFRGYRHEEKIGIFIFIVICSTVMLSDWIERIYIGRLCRAAGKI